jgi:hypothetical protein
MQGAKNHQGYRVQNLFTKAEYMAAMYLANQSKWCLAIGEGPYMGISNTTRPQTHHELYAAAVLGVVNLIYVFSGRQWFFNRAALSCIEIFCGSILLH